MTQVAAFTREAFAEAWPALPPAFVPAEHRGLAREVMRRAEEADGPYIAAVKAIVAPIEARLARKPTVREAMAVDAVRAWSAIPHPFRLAFSADATKRGALLVEDVVIGAMIERKSSWTEWENGVAVILTRLETGGGAGATMTARPIATLSLFALSRWFQRSGTRLIEDLLDDVR